MVGDLRELIKVSVPPPADIAPEVRVAVTPLAAEVNAAIPVLPGLKAGGLQKPIGPADLGYKARIPPGAPDPAPTVPVGVQVTAPVPQVTPPVPQVTAPAPPAQRLAIMFGRGEGMYSVAVEVAPDWDFDGRPMQVPGEALRALYPILEKMVRIKDQTGGEFLEPA